MENLSHPSVSVSGADKVVIFDDDPNFGALLTTKARAAGFEPSGYSGHSLRAGFATSAAAAGVQSWKIRQQTGHASDAMLMRYIRDGDLFVGNAAGSLL